MSNRLSLLWDALWWLAPFSLVGAVFGDAIRKDALTKRQRVITGAFSIMVSGVMAWTGMRELGLADYYGILIALLGPTITYDVVVLVAALLRYLRENPDKIRETLAGFLPWRKP